MTRPPRSLRILAALCLAAPATLLSLAAPLAGAASRAHAAGALQVTDSAKLRYIKSTGARIYEQGYAHGTIPGAVKVQLTLRGYTATASFTIYTKAGYISGRAQGKLKFTKNGWDTFAGTGAIAHGSGRYAHASGTGSVYGSLNRATYAMSVQIHGQVHY